MTFNKDTDPKEVLRQSEHDVKRYEQDMLNIDKMFAPIRREQTIIMVVALIAIFLITVFTLMGIIATL